MKTAMEKVQQLKSTAGSCNIEDIEDLEYEHRITMMRHGQACRSTKTERFLENTTKQCEDYHRFNNMVVTTDAMIITDDETASSMTVSSLEGGQQLHDKVSSNSSTISLSGGSVLSESSKILCCSCCSDDDGRHSMSVGVKHQKFTMCQVQQHNNESSAWIIAKQNVYDVTPFLSNHPGGSYSLLKYAGGVKDTYKDLMFHSKNGQKMWSKYLIGSLTECPFEYMKKLESVDTNSVMGAFLVDKKKQNDGDDSEGGCVIS